MGLSLLRNEARRHFGGQESAAGLEKRLLHGVSGVGGGGTKGLPLLANPERPDRNTVSVGMLVDRYLAEEIPERYSTGPSYRSYIEKWIEPKWQEYALAVMKSMAVEQCLGSLPLALKTRHHVRGIMRVVFQCALRWELITRNPIDLVRVKGAPSGRAFPGFCSPRISRACSENSSSRFGPWFRSPAVGLRASEIVALQWGDFDWKLLTLR